MTDRVVSTLHGADLELGEGPAYDPAADIAWWFDVVGKKLFEHRFSNGETMAHDLPRMASVMARIDGGRQLLAMEDGLYIRDITTGRLTLHAPLEAGNPATRSNDGRTHPSGALWIGTMGRNAEKHAGAIYWHNGRETRTLFKQVTIPNAICFSPDGTTGYFADSAKGLLMRVDLDPLTGLPTGEPAVFFDNRGGNGGLDGAVVDRNGILWNARWGAGSVDAYAPDGQRIETIAFPATQTSCPAFCGNNGENMIVTSAWQGQTADQRRTDTQAGNTFLVSGGFHGMFDPVFRIAD